MKKLGIYLSGSPKCGGTYSYNKTLLDALIYYIKQNPRNELIVYYLDPYWEPYLLDHKLNKKLVKECFFSKVISRISRLKIFSVKLARKLNQKFSYLCKNMKAENCTLWFFPSQDSISFLYPLPSVVAIHDLMHRYESRFPEVGNKKEYAVREYSYSNMVKFCKAIFVDSQVGKEQVCECYSADSNKIFILPYVAGEIFDLSYKAKENFNKKYKLPKKYLFYPAQFWLHKNHLNLLDAFHLIKKEFTDLDMVFVGQEKNAIQLIKDKIKNLELNNRVYILGFVDEQDVPEFYKRAVALIMPTYFGPTNIPPLEAFAMSCPVLISRIYGIPNQLGEAAIYFNPSDPSEIAKKIRELFLCPEQIRTKISSGLNHVKNWSNISFYDLLSQHLFSIFNTIQRDLE